MSKVEFISSYLNQKYFQYQNDLDQESIDIIYQLYSDGTLDETQVLTPACAKYIALYYSFQYESNKNQEYDLLIKKYLQISVNGGNVDAMQYLGGYYYSHDDPDNMIKYTLMAINGDNVDAMYQLARHYEMENDIENMIKYCTMAAERGHVKAIHNLIIYYGDQKDECNMYRYYTMAAKHGDIDAMFILAHYYHRHEDYANMMKYLFMTLDYSNNYFWIRDKLQDYIHENSIITYLIKKYQSLKAKQKQIKKNK